jgi:hypothetical protein
MRAHAVFKFVHGAFGGVREGPLRVQIRHPHKDSVRRRPVANAKYGVK